MPNDRLPRKAALPVAAWGAAPGVLLGRGSGSQSNQYISMRSAAAAHPGMFMFSLYCSVKQTERVLGRCLTLRLGLGVGTNQHGGVFWLQPWLVTSAFPLTCVAFLCLFLQQECCGMGAAEAEVWIVQQRLPKMNLFFPGHASLEASHALLQTGHVDSCDFAVPPGRLVAWQ